VLGKAPIRSRSARPVGALPTPPGPADSSTPVHATQERRRSRKQESGQDRRHRKRHSRLSVVGVADRPGRGQHAVIGQRLGVVDRGVLPGLNRCWQRCVREMNLGIAWDGCTGVRRGDWVGVARLSSRRLARRAVRSGDSRVRAVRGARRGARPASPCSAELARTALIERRIVSCGRLRPLPGAR
jgi:hypothetical protein